MIFLTSPRATSRSSPHSLSGDPAGARVIHRRSPAGGYAGALKDTSMGSSTFTRARATVMLGGGAKSWPQAVSKTSAARFR